MRSLNSVEQDFRDELDKSKTFIRTYDSSWMFKLVALYVFLVFSTLMTLFYLPVRYMVIAVVTRVFKTFNEITPNRDLYNYKTMSREAEVRE